MKRPISPSAARAWRAWFAQLFALATLHGATQSRAQLDVTELAEANPEVVDALRRAHSAGSFLLRSQTAPHQHPRQIAVGPRFSVVANDAIFAAADAAFADPEASELTAGSARLWWSAPKRLLLDKARGAIGLDAWHAQRQRAGLAAGSGAGVVVGIVDSGVDFAHPDLQTESGSTRAAWWIDFGTSPAGLHPQLEAEYGCTAEEAEEQCRILSAADLNALLRGESLQSPTDVSIALPTDTLGHGTHVASLAAGAGHADERYAGVAPAATLVVARVANEATEVSDRDVLLATRFVFERAQDLGMPAVVNLSLGGDFGPHTGQAATDRALVELAQGPGKALVVAAGNSGILLSSQGRYPEPLGIHTEVHLSKGASVRVPVLLPARVQPGEGALLIWIEGLAQDQFAVGLEDADGSDIIPPQPIGSAVARTEGEREIIVINQARTEGLLPPGDHRLGAAVILFGTFQASRVYALRLVGTGNASLWIQSLGSAGPEAQSEGAMFPGATNAGTISLPATAPELIAVGATINRQRWPRREGGTAALFDFGAPNGLPTGTPAFFSSLGPNQVGDLKPDILAPGVAVVAAMSQAADPDRSGAQFQSMFYGSAVCASSLSCSVVDDQYAVALGTSMASPLVAGAVALLLEQDPTLSQAELLALIQAGSRSLQTGSVSEKAGVEPGVLDLSASMRSLSLYRAPTATAQPSARSWLSLSDSFARPGADAPLGAALHLRDAAGKPVLAELSKLSIRVSHGQVLDTPTSPVPGLVLFDVAADADANGERMSIAVHYKDELLLQRATPVALDPNALYRGVSARGGCHAARGPGTSAQGLFVFSVLSLIVLSRRARRRCP